jgi:hypothetical protein
LTHCHFPLSKRNAKKSVTFDLVSGDCSLRSFWSIFHSASSQHAHDVTVAAFGGRGGHGDGTLAVRGGELRQSRRIRGDSPPVTQAETRSQKVRS